VVSVPGEQSEFPYAYVVTAHHVIDGLEVPAGLLIPNLNGSGYYAPVRLITDWRRPLPDVDLAVAILRPTPNQPVSAIGIDAVLPTDDAPMGGAVARMARPILGSTMYYVGVFEPELRMMVRAGTIGAIDQEGLNHDGHYDYPAHLVDCRSYTGFSGSPCFVEVLYAGLEPTENAPTVPPEWKWPPLGGVVSVCLLAGMFTAHYTDEGMLDTNPENAISRYGVGVMLRGNEIREALMAEDLKDERRELDALLVAQTNHLQTDPNTP